MYVLVSLATGLIAYALLIVSPPASKLLDGGGNLYGAGAVVAATLVSTLALRRMILRPGLGSLVGAGILHALLSAVMFTTGLVVLGRILFGGGSLVGIPLEVLVSAVYAVVYCAMTGYVTFPLGWLTVWALRQLPRPGSAAPAPRAGSGG
ncbi:MAG: hypothetical protein NXI31_26415 [bacterium]|nr:hypothetical protein [bacterium]